MSNLWFEAIEVSDGGCSHGIFGCGGGYAGGGLSRCKWCGGARGVWAKKHTLWDFLLVIFRRHCCGWGLILNWITVWGLDGDGREVRGWGGGGWVGSGGG